MRGQQYPDDVKAEAMAALLAGQSVTAIAKRYSIPKGTVSSWRKQARQKVKAGAESTQKTTLDELLMGYVRENLLTLREQARVFRDEEWLQRQSASEVAVLHGVLADKTVRLLEAFGGDEGETDA